MKHDKAIKPQPWRGYSLEELAHRQAINAVKQQMTLEQLSTVYAHMASSPGAALTADAGGGGLLSRLSDRLSKIMTYATYGAQALKVARQVRNIIAQFRNK